MDGIRLTHDWGTRTMRSDLICVFKVKHDSEGRFRPLEETGDGGWVPKRHHTKTVGIGVFSVLTAMNM